MRFTAELLATGGTTTGSEVPEQVVEDLAAGKRPKVVVTLGGHTWRSSIASMGGRMMLGVSAANREAAGVEAGQSYEVDVELDDAPGTVEVPAALAEALAADPAAQAAWDRLSYSAQRGQAEPIAAAKGEDTRARRVAKTLEGLRS
ncbi:DUF1905 domain-containing protein [Nocardioides mangrovicus]|uniref:DUF1905 domain-containing protein n=1 Tax=Nocardioides mangrovicus TaxID=2478913 RepID=A0A3L8P162_9ACTN|nr:YdeI/OmpD-associated family protein [Nocardioides mangrovicus]RLV48128.1 DUF1905 domain-containing protein [Nocardioides mangrovicus]